MEHDPTNQGNPLIEAESILEFLYRAYSYDLDISVDRVKGNAGWMRTARKMAQSVVGDMAYPATVFMPLGAGGVPLGEQQPFRASNPLHQLRPDRDEELAFLSVIELAKLIETRQISPVELTRFYIDRCLKYNAQLFCVINLLEEEAIKQAKKAEQEIVSGHYRGVLHGIPWGIKDMFFTRGVPTTFGFEELKACVVDEDATVVTRLREAGAILLAKLSLSQGGGHPEDRWFGGMTRNPWNLDENCLGSSSGSGSATAAGLVGFSIGQENTGSIVNPSWRCGIVGLCPTYGRVSRYGAISIGLSHDKVGPMCRITEDCAAVFQAIQGSDGKDWSVVNAPFNWEPKIRVAGLRIGYVASILENVSDADERALYDAAFEVYRDLGATVEPMAFPESWQKLVPPLCDQIRDGEHVSSRAFHAAFPSEKVDLDSVSREAILQNLAPYFERINTAQDNMLFQQARGVFCREMAALFDRYDFVIYTNPDEQVSVTYFTNFAGFPVLTVPCGFLNRSPKGFCMIGKAYDDARLLGIGRAYEQATGWHKRHPSLSSLSI